ncbi:hypothetical protein Tco_0895448 [Tanacetum coccineum]|uniref:RNA polymerase alpha subunit n=1 Tax=Tanacetum coccineum TaxID=301880 RepID=A0ABQ5CEL6_9ASTR
MEYLVKVSRKARILELKRRNLKITDSDYSIRCIHQGRYGVSVPALHQIPRRIQVQYAVSKNINTPYSRLIIHEDSGRYQPQSLLQETPNTPYASESLNHQVDQETNKGAQKVKKEPQHHRKTLVIFAQPNTRSIKVSMDDSNITMEDYIRLEEEKAHRRGKVYNWETATYGRIWCNVYDLRSVETEFPAIVFDDAFTSEVTPSCEPTVSPLNDTNIDFRISFDESDNKDYTAIYDKNSFSYKIISKTDLENDNDKVNMPSFPSPKPTVSYFSDLDFFKDFENEFPAIVYNDALTSKSDFSTEPTLSPQHIDEFDLKNEKSLSECDE